MAAQDAAARMRVVVVGSGIAGLSAALRASRAGQEVVLVSKGALAESNTWHAQGGIAVALFEDDSVASHVADTLRAGAGLSDPHAVEVLCAEGPERVRELIALGVGFDHDASGELARGREAAHSARRVLHAGGDATGLAIETGLLRAIADAPVEVHEHAMLRDLLVTDGRVTGIELMTADGAELELAADAVILATGGAGRLFAHTTNPEVTTGDGIAAAYRAGAAVADLEFVQFHPTALAIPGTPLVSEAVRGDGAVLRDETGHRFMLDVHPDAELAPRDVVARGIADAMARQGGRPVLLDATALGEGLVTRFPGITATTRAAGFDWTREPIPVTPAAHYLMGGVATDDAGRSSLPGLFVIGEAARTGVHGANRLASNSLLEGLVFAARAVDALTVPAAPLAEERRAATRLEAASSAVATFETAAPRLPQAAMTRPALQHLMWTHAGLARDAAALHDAQQTLAAWTAPAPTSVAAIEDANLLQLARLVVAAAAARAESRGAHFRTDFRATDPAQAHSTSWTIPAPTRLAIPELAA